MSSIELNGNNNISLLLTPIKDVDNEDLYYLKDGSDTCWLEIKLTGRDFDVVGKDAPNIYDTLQYSKEELKDKIASLVLEIIATEQSGTENTENAIISEKKQIVNPYNPDEIKVSSKQFNIRTIKELIDNDGLELDPDFQRHFVWNKQQQSLLIESILLRIPLPMFYFSEDAEGKLTVIDGLQRLTAINNFMEGKFPLKDLEYLKDSCEGKYFNELTPKYSRWFNLTQIFGNVIDPSSPYKVKYDIFRRINTGGKPLNNQEIRNCLAGKGLRSTLQTMVSLPEFKCATDNSVKPARMDDEELALRFILFRRILSEHRQIPDYNGYMDISLDKLTEDLHKSTQEDLLQYIHKFSTAMKNASYVFGNKNAFRKIKLDDTRKQLINKALFVSWSVLLADYDTKTIMNSNKQQCLLMPLSQKLNEDSTLRNYLSHGTNGKANLQYAFSCANELIQKHLKY